MLSPDIRPHHQPIPEQTWFFVDTPKRKTDMPVGGWQKNWLNLIETDWPRLTEEAYRSLSRQRDTALKPDLLTAETKDEQFRFTGYDLQTQIITIGYPADIRVALNNLDIGQRVKPTEQEQKSGQRAYIFSRSELFQLFIAVWAKLKINSKTKMSKKNRQKLEKAKRKTRGRISIDKETPLKINGLEKVETPQSVVEAKVSDMQRVILFGADQEARIEYRKRPPVTNLETQEEIDRLMRKKPERGGPMMNVR